MKPPYHWAKVRFDPFDRPKPLVVELAGFIGEVRSRQTNAGRPDRFQMRPEAAEMILRIGGVKNPNDLTNVAQAAAYEKIMEDYEQGVAVTNQLQTWLQRVDLTLSLRLVRMCSHFPSSDPQNADFLKQVAAAARLTEEERRHLR